MTEPRITSFLLSVAAGANTYAKIAARQVCTVKSARQNVTEACRLGLLVVDVSGTIILTNEGAGEAARALMGQR